mmetsp:Transcript_9125/g.22984  ORF Transcript_9125/g.22984 Transcript_9125/m.22984 type:complete len:444 (+) Transcript_9125:879-2210(+)
MVFHLCAELVQQLQVVLLIHDLDLAQVLCGHALRRHRGGVVLQALRRQPLLRHRGDVRNAGPLLLARRPLRAWCALCLGVALLAARLEIPTHGRRNVALQRRAVRLLQPVVDVPQPRLGQVHLQPAPHRLPVLRVRALAVLQLLLDVLVQLQELPVALVSHHLPQVRVDADVQAGLLSHCWRDGLAPHVRAVHLVAARRLRQVRLAHRHEAVPKLLVLLLLYVQLLMHADVRFQVLQLLQRDVLKDLVRHGKMDVVRGVHVQVLGQQVHWLGAPLAQPDVGAHLGLLQVELLLLLLQLRGVRQGALPLDEGQLLLHARLLLLALMPPLLDLLDLRHPLLLPQALSGGAELAHVGALLDLLLQLLVPHKLVGELRVAKRVLLVRVARHSTLLFLQLLGHLLGQLLRPAAFLLAVALPLARLPAVIVAIPPLGLLLLALFLLLLA